MIRALDNSIKNNASLPLFFVFTAEHLNKITCKGNPALVIFTDKLPTLTEHLNFTQLIQSRSNQQNPLPDNVTVSYVSTNTNNNYKVTGIHEYSIRWFSPTSIIQRCGHGTLAAAAFVNQHIKKHKPSHSIATHIRFYSDKEALNVEVHCNGPSQKPMSQYCLRLKYETLLPSYYQQHFTHKIIRENKTASDDGYLIIELNNEYDVNHFILTESIIGIIKKRALIITATSQNNDYDVVFRYFAPFYGELEDSATGSAGSLLMPFWQHLCINTCQHRSNKPSTNTQQHETHHISDNKTSSLRCYQASKNGGFFILNRSTSTSNSTNNSVEVTGYIKETKI